MKKESAVLESKLDSLLAPYPREVRVALEKFARQTGEEVFLVGGTVRDALLGCIPGDLDLTIRRDAAGCCRSLIRLLAGGTFVDLGGTGEDVARIVFRGLTIDISGFRADAATIQDDLCRRDFTINAMAVPFSSLQGNAGHVLLIDPLGGLNDLASRLLRSCPGAFSDDPLRLLRGFRFSATLGFSLTEETLAEITRYVALIGRPAAERLNHELDLIMESDRAFSTLHLMHRSGLLGVIVPELYAGLGVEQPEFHHLDVFHHCLLALEKVEDVIGNPGRFFAGCDELLAAYLRAPEVRRCLKWATLLHDIGKPESREVQAGQEGRVTFYGHDEIGARRFQGFAERLKWSNDDRQRTGNLIAMHMHPFHLCNVQRTEPLSKRAILKLCKRAGDELYGLFLLAMADSLASSGEKKPADMEAELANLLRTVLDVYERDIRSVVSSPPLLSGRDLINEFALQPGPIFSVILRELEAQRVEGRIRNRQEAMDWVAACLREGLGKMKDCTFEQDGSSGFRLVKEN